jgi:hypothetical protein
VLVKVKMSCKNGIEFVLLLGNLEKGIPCSEGQQRSTNNDSWNCGLAQAKGQLKYRGRGCGNVSAVQFQGSAVVLLSKM